MGEFYKNEKGYLIEAPFSSSKQITTNINQFFEVEAIRFSFEMDTFELVEVVNEPLYRKQFSAKIYYYFV